MYGTRPAACGIAPGRVEVLGNHTDYNGGAVLTAAIDRYMVAVGRPTAERRVRVHSLNLRASGEIPLDDTAPDPRPSWTSYIKSVFAVLAGAGMRTGGMEIVDASDIPVGAGLSSSAAIEAAVARLVLQVYGGTVEPMALAKLLQRGENEYAGVQCGLLDQFSSIHGRADCVLFLDCTTCEHEALPLGPRAPAIVVIDSRVSRKLGRDAPYNFRRGECEEAFACLRRELSRPLTGLCQASMEELDQFAGRIPEPALSRARHVVGEHERVLAAREALAQGDVERLGALMGQSHASSRAYFENSCDALDRLCELAADQPGFLGGRLCGAGWGGCTVNFVAPGDVESFVEGMNRAVAAWPGPRPQVHVCYASDGATARTLELRKANSE